MLGTVLRSRALALPGSVLSITRFHPVLSISARSLPASTFRPFTSSHILREDGDGDARGRYDQPRADRFGERRPRPSRNPPSQTLWIGNLPFSARSTQLEELFSEFGTVRSVRIGVSPTGESKGFAHLDFGDLTTTATIMQANAESQFYLDGRGLFMDYAPPTRKVEHPPSNSLYFSGFSGDEEMLEEAFKDFKDVITRLQLMRNPQTNESNRFGFVEFTTIDDATTVLNKFQGKEIAYGEVLNLSYARGRRPVPPKSFDQGGENFSYGTRSDRRGGEGRSPGEYENRPPRSYGGRQNDRGRSRESWNNRFASGGSSGGGLGDIGSN